MVQTQQCDRGKKFLGAAQYWRKFIANFSSIAAPLHDVTSVK
jgi:hypothetical protein